MASGRPGPKQMRLEDAIAASGVPRASAYRAWSDFDDDPEARPQDRFRAQTEKDLLVRSKNAGNELLDGTIAAVQPLLDEVSRPGFDQLTAAERKTISDELFRVGGNLVYRQISSDPIWRMYLDLIVGADPADIDSESILGLEGSDGRIIERFLDFFVELVMLLGARLRPGLRLGQFGEALVALMRGMVIPPPDPTSHWVTTETGDQWSLFSVSLVGLYGVFFEDDPDNGPDCEVQTGLSVRFES